jgi:hypothetical protein
MVSLFGRNLKFKLATVGFHISPAFQIDRYLVSWYDPNFKFYLSFPHITPALCAMTDGAPRGPQATEHLYNLVAR